MNELSEALLQVKHTLHTLIQEASEKDEVTKLDVLIGLDESLTALVRRSLVVFNPPPPIDTPPTQYLREGNRLIKLGYSLKKQSTYRHTCTLPQLTSIVKQFHATTPKTIADLANEIPIFATYAALGWLKQEGFLLKHGRRGYTQSPRPNLVAAIRQRFAQLGRPST